MLSIKTFTVNWIWVEVYTSKKYGCLVNPSLMERQVPLIKRHSSFVLCIPPTKKESFIQSSKVKKFHALLKSQKNSGQNAINKYKRNNCTTSQNESKNRAP